MRRVPDYNPVCLYGHGCVDRGFKCTVDTKSQDRVGWVVKVLVVQPGTPNVTQRGCESEGNDCRTEDGSLDSCTGVRTG